MQEQVPESNFDDSRQMEDDEEDEEDEGPIMTTPSVYVEPEVPQPFLVEEDDNLESPSPASSQQQIRIPQQTNPPVSPVSPSAFSQSLPSPNVNKDVPPPPSESDAEDEDAPEVYLPEIVIPTMFLPIPNTDPLTTLLTKYIHPPDRRPVRDLSGEWQNANFHSLVMANSWRALARMARDRIVTTDPQDLALVLGLWYLRLACLSRLRLFNQTSAECTNLFSVLNGIEPPEAKAYVFDRVLPFELEVMQARLKYWAGDHIGYLDALNLLLKKCRSKARSSSDDVNVGMWKERGARLCLIIASQLMEMKVNFMHCILLLQTGKLLEPLCNTKNSGGESPALRSAIARIYLQGGYLAKATTHFAAVDADPSADQTLKDMNKALLASANGEWKYASETLKKLLENDPDNYVAVNNLSVALLSQGKLKEGIDVLEKALKSSPSSVVVAEPFLFNLSTLYELRSATATEKKLELLIEVAKWSGDGLKTTCLKMPSN
ncbi:hypothetical protein K435DRAFT_817676 [Dendrothele bispora CBS 962.96]|uniref:Uncharacterized protein n=1 Tax=Dendrothele bispora (strain CBS 962.96) TaxID=1314807 RepID=A0A4S8MJ99_DENBC|nr:hypothetical protein K435DRAFT_817676 [Dendrothele bispora CBS 962.96]